MEATSQDPPRSNRGRIVVAKVGLDGHDRGARLVARLLRGEGFDVVFVGVRHSPEQVAQIALAEGADVVGLSLLSGAHVELSAAVRRELDALGLQRVPIALGGLVPRHDAGALHAAGVARVFHPGADAQNVEGIVTAMDELVGHSRQASEVQRG